ncbi:hypothetical protein SAMN05216388_10526 [Halorientalis persicus]|uniref:Uncharacterized protein n=1 Tax=Halorientalis persicus TaxID=1367881 RepID=A0A1H8W950_9EURY|nr:hypothetical protein SAMN05216388_10526 [Halorientalis persicus]
MVRIRHEYSVDADHLRITIKPTAHDKDIVFLAESKCKHCIRVRVNSTVPVPLRPVNKFESRWERLD